MTELFAYPGLGLKFCLYQTGASLQRELGREYEVNSPGADNETIHVGY